MKNSSDDYTSNNSQDDVGVEYTPTNRQKVQDNRCEDYDKFHRDWSIRNWNHVVNILAKYVGHPYDDALKNIYKKFPGKKHRHELNQTLDWIVHTAAEASSRRYSYCVDLFWKDENGILRRRRKTEPKKDYIYVQLPEDQWIIEWYPNESSFGANVHAFLYIMDKLYPDFKKGISTWIYNAPLPENDVKYILDTYGEKVGQYVIDNNIDPFLVHLYNQNPIDITRAMTFNRVVKNRYIHIKKGTTEYYQYIKSKKKK